MPRPLGPALLLLGCENRVPVNGENEHHAWRMSIFLCTRLRYTVHYMYCLRVRPFTYICLYHTCMCLL